MVVNGTQRAAKPKILCQIAYILLGALPMFGCNTTEPASISGVVVFAEEPIEEGTVRFHPVGDTLGAGAGANIVKGKYTIDLDQGLVPGDYLVQINAWKNTGEEIPNPEPMPGEPEMIPETIQYIPTTYNQQSTLHVQIKPGANEHDLSLTDSSVKDADSNDAEKSDDKKNKAKQPEVNKKPDADKAKKP